MIRHTQNKVSIKDSNGNWVQHGNCWQTTIAAMIDYPVSEVPNFEVWFDCDFSNQAIYDRGQGFWYNHWQMTQIWLEQKRWTLDYGIIYKEAFHTEYKDLKEVEALMKRHEVNDINVEDYISYLKYTLADKLYMVSGPSSRGVSHVVIYKDGELFHDVHPSREGVLSVNEVYSLEPFRK